MEIPKPKDLLDFTGKVVVVTGASQGIGAGIAQRFGEAGAGVIVHYRSSRDGADAVVEKIRQSGGEALAVAGELTDQTQVRALVSSAVEHFGGLDVMVNNAGVFPNAGLLDMSHDEWRKMISANLDTAYLGTQAAAHHMKSVGNGAIINLASISAINPASNHSHYNSAKAGVVMLTRSAAQELGPLGIRVNCISPGLISRAGLEGAWPEGVARWQQSAPLGEMGTPEDIGDACLFLASIAARWITGVNLVVDGGVMSSMIF
jgi:NAD(P)-dependent dehydrogenase (short-subunit alcohol dehydrogenase family)